MQTPPTEIAEMSNELLDAAIELCMSAEAQADYATRHAAALAALARYGEGHDAPAMPPGYDASEA